MERQKIVSRNSTPAKGLGTLMAQSRNITEIHVPRRKYVVSGMQSVSIWC